MERHARKWSGLNERQKIRHYRARSTEEEEEEEEGEIAGLAIFLIRAARP